MIIYTVNIELRSFVCRCGNTCSKEGFEPSNIYGILQEPDVDWEKYYRCNRCLQVYQHKDGE